MSRIRQDHHSQELIVHLNINSLQNEVDKLTLINGKMKASVLILAETKIDSTCTNNQFRLSNYRLYRSDRKKGGGGVIVYVKEGIAVKRLKILHSFTTVEVIALDIKLSGSNCVVLCIYRPPRSDTTSYLANVEEELNSVHSWALSQRQTLVTFGDLNLDRLQPESAKGKVLLDLEDIFQLECLIKEPTRKKALLHVILTNKPEMFDQSGVIEFGLSDH